MDGFLIWLTTPMGVVAIGLGGVAVGAIGATFGLLTFVLPPRERIKKLQWAPWELTPAPESGGIAITNVAIWNGGPTLLGDEFATLAPLEVVASDGAVLDHVEVASVKNPANAVKVRRRTDHRTRARVDFEYLNPGDGFVLTVRHTGASPQIKGEIVGAAAPQPSAAQLARSVMHMFSVLMRGPRQAKNELWLRRLSGVYLLVMMPFAPYALNLKWDWRILAGYEAMCGVAIALQLMTTVRYEWAPMVPAGLEAALGFDQESIAHMRADRKPLHRIILQAIARRRG